MGEIVEVVTLYGAKRDRPHRDPSFSELVRALECRARRPVNSVGSRRFAEVEYQNRARPSCFGVRGGYVQELSSPFEKSTEVGAPSLLRGREIGKRRQHGIGRTHGYEHLRLDDESRRAHGLSVHADRERRQTHMIPASRKTLHQRSRNSELQSVNRVARVSRPELRRRQKAASLLRRSAIASDDTILVDVDPRSHQGECGTVDHDHDIGLNERRRSDSLGCFDGGKRLVGRRILGGASDSDFVCPTRRCRRLVRACFGRAAETHQAEKENHRQIALNSLHHDNASGEIRSPARLSLISAGPAAGEDPSDDTMRTMKETKTFPGGCLCGSLRYEARDPFEAGYCHCRLCQRSSGAPVLAWAGFPTSSFTYAKGEPRSYSSSTRGRRDFCSACGTQIGFRDTAAPTRVYVNIATLDDPTSVEPEYHIWLDSSLPWFHIDDDLPRYADEGPDSPNS